MMLLELLQLPEPMVSHWLIFQIPLEQNILVEIAGQVKGRDFEEEALSPHLKGHVILGLTTNSYIM